MKRIWLFLISGLLLIVVGVIWTLQGLNVLGGSVMSGSSFWATVGPIVLVTGVVLIAISIGLALKRHRTPGARQPGE